MTNRLARDVLVRESIVFLSRSRPVADLLFVVLTVVLFAGLTVLIRAVERW
jgi:hypothetical protein